ncbi:MAG: hypothetical protein HUU16_19770 [Candidatus Omnitrophica bacterium]|nr:hypothetical protein [Candidatus Omnitrophota bacterium]
MGGQFGGGLGGAGLGGAGLGGSSFGSAAESEDPTTFSPVDTLVLQMGRGYSVVEYYGASYLVSDQIVYDDRGRVKPKETAERSFPWLRDFPGLTDIIAEIIDPDGHGSILIEWDFDLEALQLIADVPRSDIKPEGGLAPPENLYDETEIPLLVNSDNPSVPRRFTLADYYGWVLGPEATFREPGDPNHLGAFDSPSLPITSISF